ncbi:Glycosyltransferase involved in cell wall bisynthesis [Pedococcus cremeus]|uniref:Glycosyltransferase involved in cell wall bisynthesis n=1 Tax=Pedococcus cremeus TaxID=587636 RepID=A0A1H9RKN7_9MICO|nr:glycosyltransferase [Pedococcus cremeus]SER73320.1 Glycosyltransferase involved in cell wall bisynthesis [Pedococcus cremeus]
MTRVLIDASNLKVGGGVQVAASFIEELIQLMKDPEYLREWPWLDSVMIDASSSVVNQLPMSARAHVTLKNRTWRSAFDRRRNRLLSARFTVFGPFYGKANARIHIMGCADVTLLSPHPSGVPPLPLPTRIKRHIRKPIAAHSFKSADVLVTETDAIRKHLVDHLAISPRSIEVVPNAIHEIFRHPERWLPLPLPKTDPGTVRLAYVARAYPHKNIDFLGSLGAAVLQMYGTRLQFLLTLHDSEWSGLSSLTKTYACNVGELSIGQVPTLLSQCDGVIFPSLLEAFSATPLEGMALGKAVYASNRDFVRTVCADYPIYFDPLDPTSAAHTVASHIASCRHQALDHDAAKRPTAHTWTARDRALAYIRIIDSSMKNCPPAHDS